MTSLPCNSVKWPWWLAATIKSKRVCVACSQEIMMIPRSDTASASPWTNGSVPLVVATTCTRKSDSNSPRTSHNRVKVVMLCTTARTTRTGRTVVHLSAPSPTGTCCATMPTKCFPDPDHPRPMLTRPAYLWARPKPPGWSARPAAAPACASSPNHGRFAGADRPLGVQECERPSTETWPSSASNWAVCAGRPRRRCGRPPRRCWSRTCPWPSRCWSRTVTWASGVTGVRSRPTACWPCRPGCRGPACGAGRGLRRRARRAHG
ncbi:hypothetical protein DFQ13_116148 [Actinokineospora spheciospongiae]|nr:hypothetical protein DFQ13_116148 [Actinokineospora spheciospongiae]